MSPRALVALVRKDLLIFFTDRYAVILSFAAPIALASFMAAIFGGAGRATPSKIPVRLVDLDGGEVSRAIVARALAEPMLAAVVAATSEGEGAVRRGEAVVAVVIPPGFGDRASEAVFGGPAPPLLTFVGDPTREADLSMVRGLLTRLVLETVASGPLGDMSEERILAEIAGGRARDPIRDDDLARADFLALFPGVPSSGEAPPDDSARSEFVDAFPGLADLVDGKATGREEPPAGPKESGGFRMPFESRDVSIAGGGDGPRAAMAGHAFASMVVQFVLFSAIEWGIGLIVERQRGIWKRLRAAPVARSTLLASKAIGCAIVALAITLAVLGFGAVAFRFRVRGDPLAFALVALAYALTASTFGLLVAAAGRTPNAARSISILMVLVMVLLGGGWIPSFLFPDWLRRLTVFVPTRWAIDGFDGVLSRGFSLVETLPTIGALLAFAGGFSLLALASRPAGAGQARPSG